MPAATTISWTVRDGEGVAEVWAGWCELLWVCGAGAWVEGRGEEEADG